MPYKTKSALLPNIIAKCAKKGSRTAVRLQAAIVCVCTEKQREKATLNYAMKAEWRGSVWKKANYFAMYAVTAYLFRPNNKLTGQYERRRKRKEQNKN